MTSLEVPGSADCTASTKVAAADEASAVSVISLADGADGALEGVLPLSLLPWLLLCASSSTCSEAVSEPFECWSMDVGEEATGAEAEGAASPAETALVGCVSAKSVDAASSERAGSGGEEAGLVGGVDGSGCTTRLLRRGDLSALIGVVVAGEVKVDVDGIRVGEAEAAADADEREEPAGSGLSAGVACRSCKGALLALALLSCC